MLDYKRYEQIGDAILFLLNQCSNEQKKEIKKGLERHIFLSKKKEDPIPHPNSLKFKKKIQPPKDYLEAILILMNPLYNANTANNIKNYVIYKLDESF